MAYSPAPISVMPNAARRGNPNRCSIAACSSLRWIERVARTIAVSRSIGVGGLEICASIGNQQ